MEIDFEQLVIDEAKSFIEEKTGENLEELGLTDEQILHMVEEGF